jgi:MFS family permease
VQPSSVADDRRASVVIAATVGLTFLGYLCVGLPLAVLPVFIHGRLGYSAVLAGLGVSVQYVATVVSRAQVGRMSDALGPKATALWGFVCVGVCAVFTLVSAALQTWPAGSFAAMIAGRLALGAGESMIGTAAITWAIGLVGVRHTVQIISWNGIATYSALAFGAPIGSVLMGAFGFGGIGAVVALVAALGFAIAWTRPAAAKVSAAERAGVSTRLIFRAILPYGVALACGSTGFGVIAAFVTLYYKSRGWEGAHFAISLFGAAFVLGRLVLPGPIARYGGNRVARAGLTSELVGLTLLWLAPDPAVAMLGAALTGLGFAPMFPALGVDAVAAAPSEGRGVAIGLFSMFLDIALGISGPLAGFLIGRFGYASPFAMGAVAAAIGLIVGWRLARRRTRL